MKKKNIKLSLNKSTISNLNNLDKIRGGDDVPLTLHVEGCHTILTICRSCIQTNCNCPPHTDEVSVCVACVSDMC